MQFYYIYPSSLLAIKNKKNTYRIQKLSKKESIIQGLSPNSRFKAEFASGGKMFREISPVFWNAFGAKKVFY
jgi:hypothetical protein